MARIVLEFSDDPNLTNGVQMKIAHDPFPTHDEDGNDLPPTPAMLCAAKMVETYHSLSNAQLEPVVMPFKTSAVPNGDRANELGD